MVGFQEKYLQTVTLFWLPIVETKLRFCLATSCTTNINSSSNNIRPLTGIILRDPSLNERPSKRSNKRSRVQYRRYSQYRNKQSVLDYRNVEQIKHLYALVSTLSCKHQWILDVQFHPNVIGNLYLQHI